MQQDERDVDVRVQAPDDLEAYRRENSRRIAALSRGPGAVRVVVTLQSPMASEDLDSLVGESVTVESFEAVGRTQDGQIMTIGGPGLGEDAGREFELRDAEIDGIVAFEGVVASHQALVSLTRHPQVFLADVAKESVAREAPGWVRDLRRGGSIDIILNDVYWLYAGWSP